MSAACERCLLFPGPLTAVGPISSGGFTNAAAAAICIFARESSETETFTIVNVCFSVNHSRCECSKRDHLFQVLSALSNPDFWYHIEPLCSA